MSNPQITVDGTAGYIQPDGNVRFNPDERMNVTIYNKAVHDPVESRNRGRPWSKNMVYIRLQQPGEKDYVDRPINDTDPMRFPRHWDAFQRGQQQMPNGTPVDVLFPQNPEIPANLHGLGVHTIEQLAGLTEHGAQTIGMGSTMWRNKAKEFLAAANGGAGMHKLQAQLDKANSVIEAQANQMALMKAQIDALAAQVNQKIAPSMVTQPRPTMAQSAAMSFANDEDDGPSSEGDPVGEMIGETYSPPVSAEPLFVEDQEEPSQDAPKARGWPKGKPRGPRNAN